uniref:Uncharacterized protein n=1 Tax=Arundo donax TaxID=35708 RepID=A0A0A9ACG9_ARUDO
MCYLGLQTLESLLLWIIASLEHKMVKLQELWIGGTVD